MVFSNLKHSRAVRFSMVSGFSNSRLDSNSIANNLFDLNHLGNQVDSFCNIKIHMTPYHIHSTAVHTPDVVQLYSHIHVINAQLAMEMFPDVTTKPHRLREKQ